MRRRAQRKPSHSRDPRRAAVSSAAYPRFPDRETWLPYGYVAELGQLNVCSTLGITDCEFVNGAAYLAHWLDILREDKREIFRVAADAQRAADYLLNFHPDYAARLKAAASPSDRAPADEMETFLKAAA
jgi:antirestriction protein ArdC